MSVLLAFIVLTCLGIILCIGLNIADKKLAEKKDEKLEKIESIMPGANCGGCGFAGCADYAKAVFEGKANPGLCAPGGQKLADEMGSIMGIEVGNVEKCVARVFCNATCSDKTNKFVYKGIDDCNAAAMLFNGMNACNYSCLGLLSCQKVCENNAISINENGNIFVDENKCIGCGKCVAVCPHKVIKLVPYDQSYIVKCNNKDKGAAVNKACKAGCIGCKICETKFPECGIKVEDNLASVIDSKNIEALEAAAQACPKKVIVKIK